MGLKEDRSYLAESRATREAKALEDRKQVEQSLIESYTELDDLKHNREKALDEFYEYKDNVKEVLVRTALSNICENSLINPTERQRKICDNLVAQYVREAGVTKLLKNMKFSENALLRTINEEVEEKFTYITKDATPDDPSSMTISQDEIKGFWKDVDDIEDIDDVTGLIRLRVANAEEDFVNKNKEDKDSIKNILRGTADRIKNAAAKGDEEFKDAVEESESYLAKDKIYKIQHEGYRSVFDRMVHNVAEAAMKNEEFKKEYTLENGRLDMEKIVESARCMYTLLEMVGTIQLENVDRQYIEDTLKSIQ